ncbi:hypothetical protein PIROE2DRAFT_63825 [Piromyces sp. E2]|nr:hypothetical protein PIROE2DRAFT_63825 [Piromyces sp. E2]|eukprot:OUM59360.1 hypothetical protein PIROE2DRAFT_63825 [Piromyces sp. E2]
MNNEELKNEIIKIIDNDNDDINNVNDLNKLETYILDNNLKLDIINDENFDILIYAIKNDASLTTIKFVLKYGRRNLKYLLKNGFKREKINSIINNSSDTFKNDILNDICNHFIFDNHFIMMLLSRFYKNKIGLSKKELEQLIHKEKSKIVITDKMYRQAYQSKNYDLIKLFYNCDFSNDDILFRRCFKHNLMECAIHSKDINFLQSVLSFVGTNFNNIFSKNTILLAIEDNTLETPKFLIKAALDTLHSLLPSITSQDNSEGIIPKKYDTQYLSYILNTLIKIKNFPLIKYMMEDEYKSEININTSDFNGEYPIITSAHTDCLDIFDYLLSIREIDCTLKDINHQSLLSIAMRNGLPFVKCLLTKCSNIDINEEDDNKMAPIDYAINENNTELLNILLNYSSTNSIKINFYKKDINGNHPLLKAILQEKKECTSILINYGIKNKIDININGKNNNNEYPLSKAIIKKDDTCVSLILKYGQENGIDLIINEKTKDGILPLTKAITQNNDLIVYLLLEYGIKNKIDLNINEKDITGSYPLLLAMKQNNVDLISLIMKYGKECNVELNITRNDNNENYPFLSAIKKGDINIVMTFTKYIMEQGYDMPKLFENKINPLIYAYTNGYKEIFNFLINYQSIFNGNEKDFQGYSLLYHAVLKEDMPTIQYLIENGSDINSEDKNGTAIIHLLFNKSKFNEKIFNTLLQNNNIDLNKKNSDGDTLLLLLIKKNIPFAIKENYIKTIIRRGANVNIKDRNGNSPLSEAIKLNSLSIVACLLENGANVNDLIHNKKKSPLIVACENYSSFFSSGLEKSNFLSENYRIVSLLVNYGANINYMDSDGNIPLTYALMYAKLYVINYLIKYGTNLYHVNNKASLAALIKLASAECGSAFYQCGGDGFPGENCCVSGYNNFPDTLVNM